MIQLQVQTHMSKILLNLFLALSSSKILPKLGNTIKNKRNKKSKFHLDLKDILQRIQLMQELIVSELKMEDTQHLRLVTQEELKS